MAVDAGVLTDFLADFLADPAVATLFAALPGARAVGGCVRDALARRPTADIDLATPMPPDKVASALQAAGIRVVPTGLEHGTLTAVVGGRGFEVTTLRRDVVTDGRRAEVAWTDDWQVDAARRDFTINAMSMAPDGTLYDYFGGQADLRAGRVRFVGDAAVRVAEDHLRVLRFFRFQARYGIGAPDPSAVAAVSEGAASIARLSVERVWSEMKRILAAPDPAAAVALMDQLGVLAFVVTEGADPAALARLCAAGAPPDPILRLAALLTGDPAALAARLRLSHAEADRLRALRAPPLAPDVADAALRRALAVDAADTLIDRTWLAGQTGPAWDGLRMRLATTPRPVFPLEGRDVLAVGLLPGPQIGALLRAVEAWWMAGGCVADAASCRGELARLARD